MLAPAGSVVGVDVAEAALRRARARHPALTFALVPIDGALPFDDGAFDVVWSSEVIEHVADTARWLSEVRRVLVPRGRLLLTTPSHGRLRLAIGGIERYSEPLGDHLHLYSARSLRELLTEFDFEVEELRSAGGPPLLRRLLLAVVRVVPADSEPQSGGSPYRTGSGDQRRTQPAGLPVVLVSWLRPPLALADRPK